LSKRGLKNPFTAFNKLRNEILHIEPKIIYEIIRQYCVVNKISQTNYLFRDEINENTLMLDSYESLVNVVWNFLQIKVEINALNFANLIEEIKETNPNRDLGDFSYFNFLIGPFFNNLNLPSNIVS
jgi:hypothetical protein